MRAEIVLGLFLEKQRRESFVARSIVFLSTLRTYTTSRASQGKGWGKCFGGDFGASFAQFSSLATLVPFVSQRRSAILSLLRADSTSYIDNFTLL